MSEQGFGDFEFERKFYVGDVPEAAALDPAPTLIVQAYLFASDGYAVRVRVQGSAPADGSARDVARSGGAGSLVDCLTESVAGTMAAKGPAIGGTRYEAERELDALVAGEIVRRSDFVVAKVRYSMWLGEDGWVIDEFLGANSPLVMAEVERGGPVVDLAIPDFCLSEVSEDDRFRNEYLAHIPFDSWCEQYRRELALLGPRFVHSLGENRIGGV